MKRQKKFFSCRVGTLMLLFFSYLCVSGEYSQAPKPEEGKKFIIQEWLVAGPALMPLPALVGKESEFKVSNLLDLDSLDPVALWPEEGKTLPWAPGEGLTWKAQKTMDGSIKIQSAKSGPEAFFLFCYIESNRWQKVDLEIESYHLLKVFLDGESILSKTTGSQAEAKEPAPVQAELSLSCGKHRLLIMALKDPKSSLEWNLNTKLNIKQGGELISNLTPRRFITDDDLFNSPQIESVFVAPDGSALAYGMTQRNPKIAKSESWVEIRKLPGGELEQTIRDTQGCSNIQWSPDSQWLSAIVPAEKDSSNLWLIERKTRQTRVLLDNVKGLSSARWSPTGKFLVYSITEKPKDPDPKVERMTGLQDRWLPWHSKTHLYAVMVDSGVCRRLTAGTQSATGLFGSADSPVSPDGSKVLFISALPDYSSRPYLRTDIFILDLATNEAKKVFSSPFSINSAQWTSDGQNILFVAGQSMGRSSTDKSPVKKILNDYDNDLFLLNLSTGSLVSLTQNFAPSIRSARQVADGAIYLCVEDKVQEPLYITDVKGTTFRKIDVGVDAVKSYDVAENGSALVYTGSSLLTPPRLYVYDLKAKEKKVLFDPTEERFKNILLTKVEDFNFTNARGAQIEGWLHYPANFDPSKKYPLLVYYYGGTKHTTKEFRSGFLGVSHHQYTANGYAVYVLNPSGAPGWGPDFSNLHVNDWGKIVADEIITGVKKLLAAKPFLDPRYVGAYGGSYGGFMTMLLATKTDLFRACIALYGISNITSYWGAGWWGFLYSGVATAESFPWNRPDIYVGQSPIFHADKIKTPLLLLHGLADINVPSTESEQMFTALKMLGKEVEYIRFKGEDHGIRGTDENRRLMPQVMLAWWDKYLKGQPEAWEEVKKNLEYK